jgi:hypothetical protein
METQECPHVGESYNVQPHIGTSRTFARCNQDGLEDVDDLFERCCNIYRYIFVCWGSDAARFAVYAFMLLA